MKIGNQDLINVVLEEDNKTLDEVVVIGYGTVKRRDLTGSVASVSNEALVANPVADVAQALQGTIGRCFCRFLKMVVLELPVCLFVYVEEALFHKV